MRPLKPSQKALTLLSLQLLEQDMPQKLVRMVTGFSQTAVQRIASGKIRKDIDVNEPLDMETVPAKVRKRLETLESILLLPELLSTDIEQNAIYIKLLGFLMVEKDDILELYNHSSTVRISRTLLSGKIDLLGFDASLIGVDQLDYLDLVVDEVGE